MDTFIYDAQSHNEIGRVTSNGTVYEAKGWNSTEVGRVDFCGNGYVGIGVNPTLTIQGG